MTEKRVLFFIPSTNIAGDGVSESFVLGHLRHLQDLGYKCMLIASDNTIHSVESTANDLLIRCGINAHISCKYRNGIIGYSKIRNGWRIFWDYRHEIEQFAPTHLYTRGPIEIVTSLRIAQHFDIPLVYNVEGCVSEEIALMRGRKGLHYYGLRYLQNKAVRKAHRIICVSAKMGHWLEQEFGRYDYEVVPCCVRTVNRVFDLQKRCATRELLGFSTENKIICYCGGLAPWQRIETILDLAVRIANMDNNIRFLFLTRKSQDMARLIAEAHLDSSLVSVVSCGQAETPTYLSVADIGIILRHDNIINNVASPIKIAEYLASGIPVLLTRGIGDYSELLPSHNIGIICEPEKRDIEDIVLYINKLDPQELFSRCTEFANRYLRWQAYSAQFERIYR